MKGDTARPTSADFDTHAGTTSAIRKALNAPLLIDQAADAAFAAAIARLRSAPGTNKGASR